VCVWCAARRAARRPPQAGQAGGQPEFPRLVGSASRSGNRAENVKLPKLHKVERPSEARADPREPAADCTRKRGTIRLQELRRPEMGQDKRAQNARIRQDKTPRPYLQAGRIHKKKDRGTCRDPKKPRPKSTAAAAAPNPTASTPPRPRIQPPQARRLHLQVIKAYGPLMTHKEDNARVNFIDAETTTTARYLPRPFTMKMFRQIPRTEARAKYRI
jgi:hypothetical protein